jgi:hypothetical protein
MDGRDVNRKTPHFLQGKGKEKGAETYPFPQGIQVIRLKQYRQKKKAITI